MGAYMKKHRTIIVIGIILVILQASFLYLAIEPCSRPKIEVGYSIIAEILRQWEEVLEDIESPESSGISQGRVDSMERIKRQTVTVITPQCMLPVKMELYYGMETRIRAYSAILEKTSLLDELYSAQNSIPITGYSTSQVGVNGIQDELSEVEDKVVSLFISSEKYLANFSSLFAKFANRINTN